ncbi:MULTISPECIES: GAF and ANTAR domain-containing protein [unclassified Blastococcus]
MSSSDTSRTTAPAPAPAERLANALSDLARQLEHEDDPDVLLHDIVRAATTLVPGAAAASVSTVTGGTTVHSRAATGELPQRVDAVQQEVGQGPCLDTLAEHRTVRVEDMAGETRWPDFAARAAALGARSMLCFRLHVERGELGALTLYASQPHAFDAEAEQVGLLLAAHAAIAYAGAAKREDLERALDARDLIGQAKGILMERYGLTGQRAFQVLVRLSNESNRKLRDIALEVVRTPRPASAARRDARRGGGELGAVPGD